MALDDLASWPRIVIIKLSLVLLLLFVTLLHDWVVLGGARTLFDQALVLSLAWIPRRSLVLALGVVMVAVLLRQS